VVQPLAAVLRRTGAWDRVCVTSFSASRLRAARRVLDRQVCMAASPLGTAVVRFGGPRRPRELTRPGRVGSGRIGRSGPAQGRLGGPGRLAGDPGRGAPLATGRAANLALAERLARTGVRCAQVPAQVATPAFVGRAHALGLHVHAWTINSPALMQKLLDIGVDGIMTDETVALRDVLIGRGDWHPRLAG
jgi:glycerophosphoryl diester phosphodiesterase